MKDYYRHAFLYSFLLIAIAGRGLKEKISMKAVGIVAAIGVVFGFLLEYTDLRSLYLGLACLVVIGCGLAAYDRFRLSGKKVLQSGKRQGRIGDLL